MAIYWVLIAASVIIGIPMCGLCELRKGKLPLIFCIVYGAVFTIMAAVRLSVGYDYNMYATLFYNMNFMDIYEIGDIQREMGMLLPVKTLQLLTSDYVPQFFMLSAFMYPPLIIYLKKYSDNPWVGIFAFLSLGIFFNSLNFMRQFFAAIICAYAFKYAEKRNFFRFFVLCLFAACFHRSAFLIIPCYLFALVAMNGITIVIALAVTALSYIFFTEIGDVLIPNMFMYRFRAGGYASEVGLPKLYFIMFGAVFLAAFLLRKHLKGSKREINILMWCSYAAFFFELLGSKSNIVSRMALLYFVPTMFLLVPKMWCAVCGIISERLSGKKRIVCTAAALAVMLISAGALYNNLLCRNYNGVVPYQTIAVRGLSDE